MFETGLREPCKARIIKQNTRGDEIGVEAAIRSLFHKLFEVASRRRLAAGKMYLQTAQCGSLAEHALPNIRSELVAGAVQRERIRAIGALQRTAMRQFRQ